MPKTALPEWLLTRFVGHDRASVILGDLLEISATRGRLWFWTAYARTLVSVGWRATVAFLLAYGCFSWMTNHAFPIINWVRRSFYPHIHTYSHVGFWVVPFGNFLLALWFILPFVIVRFGLRDRLTQLAFAIFLFTIPFFSLTRTGVNFAGAATAATILAALCLRTWRQPVIVLAATVAPIVGAIQFSSRVWYLFLSRGYSFASPQLQRFMAIYRVGELCIAAIVCSSLYDRLLQKKLADLSTIA